MGCNPMPKKSKSTKPSLLTFAAEFRWEVARIAPRDSFQGRLPVLVKRSARVHRFRAVPPATHQTLGAGSNLTLVRSPLDLSAYRVAKDIGVSPTPSGRSLPGQGRSRPRWRADSAAISECLRNSGLTRKAITNCASSIEKPPSSRKFRYAPR